MEKDKNILEEAEDLAKSLDRQIKKETKSVFKKYPLTFTLLSITGFSAVLYGFENLFNSVLFFKEHPGYVLALGLLILLFTGTLYKWLQNKEIRLV